MLTQIQLPEPQAALPAACPRPRAVAKSVLMPSSPARVGVVRLGAAAAEERGRVRSVERARAFGFAAVERPVGYAAAARVIAAGIVGNGIDGTTSTTQDPQHKQHLTDRRGPVTWRPPH